jgi:hypothetical protein
MEWASVWRVREIFWVRQDGKTIEDEDRSGITTAAFQLALQSRIGRQRNERGF